MGSHNIIMLITLTISCAAFYFLLLMFRPFEKAVEQPKVKVISVFISFIVFLIGAYIFKSINANSAVRGITLGIWVSIVIYLTNKPKDA